MQRADFKVVLDACVLANARVCNVLLYLGKWLPAFSQALLNDIGSST